MKGWSLPVKIAAGLFVLFMFGYLTSRNNKPEVKTTPASNTSFALPKQPKKEASKWSYFSTVDKMRGNLTRFASVDSANKLYFDFPYGGGSAATLTLRISPQFGKDVILRIEKGQFLCYSYDGCSVAMKFDAGKIEDHLAYPSDTGGSEVLFLKPYGKIVSKLRASKHLTIEANFYNEGRHQMEFDVFGLKWEDQSKPNKMLRTNPANKSEAVTEEPPIEFKNKASIEEIQKQYQEDR